jgi:predicted nucleic acid-binding protein
LDACCLGRLTDDQSQARVRAEAVAIEQLLAGVRRGSVELISSEALEDEIRRNPSMERRAEAQTLLSLAGTRIDIDDAIALRAQNLMGLGYGPFDALHIAAAESAGADVLLTTDDRLLKRTTRNLGNPRIPVQNPLSWNQEQGP